MTTLSGMLSSTEALGEDVRPPDYPEHHDTKTQRSAAVITLVTSHPDLDPYDVSLPHIKCQITKTSSQLSFYFSPDDLSVSLCNAQLIKGK